MDDFEKNEQIMTAKIGKIPKNYLSKKIENSVSLW